MNNAHDVIKILDDKNKNEFAINNSHKNIMLCQVKQLGEDMKKKENEKQELEDKVKNLNTLQLDNSERINNLNVHLMQKDNSITELNEFIESLNKKFIDNERSKEDLVSKVNLLEENMKGLRQQLKFKDNDIIRLSNIKEIMEKQIAIHQLK